MWHWVCIVSVPSALSRSAASKSSVYLCYARAKSPVETINLTLWLLLRLLKHPPLPAILANDWASAASPTTSNVKTRDINMFSRMAERRPTLTRHAHPPDTLRWLNYCCPVHSTRCFLPWIYRVHSGSISGDHENVRRIF